jgi:diphthamide synthase (EF-2-diphthine--ammonia ligase)
LNPFQTQGIRRVVYGDLFLADIKAYRDQFMMRLGMEAIYPLWNRDTKKLALEFIEQGFRAKLVCVDPKQIEEILVGREFDAELLWDLPTSADPCGENGEFHTLVYASPDFANGPLHVTERERYKRNGFAYVDYQLVAAGMM